jgi:hypothetical protein
LTAIGIGTVNLIDFGSSNASTWYTLYVRNAIANQLDMHDYTRAFRFRPGIAVEVLEEVGCIDGAVVQDMLVDELYHVPSLPSHTIAMAAMAERASFWECASYIINNCTQRD